MRLGDLFKRGKRVVDDRGGVDSLKGDAQELKDIAKGKGSVADKAKEAAAALKEPGGKPAPGPDPTDGPKHGTPDPGAPGAGDPVPEPPTPPSPPKPGQG